MSRFLSPRLAGMSQSQIRNMPRECERIGGINPGQGLGDLPPPLVRDGAIQSIHERPSVYSFPEGIVGLRQPIAGKLLRDDGIEADSGSEIAVTVGSSGGFACTILGCLNPGDGIVHFEPYYGYRLNAAILAALEPQFVPPAQMNKRPNALHFAGGSSTIYARWIADWRRRRGEAGDERSFHSERGLACHRERLDWAMWQSCGASFQGFEQAEARRWSFAE